MLWRIKLFFKKMNHKDTIDTYILDDNHYVIIISAWSNFDTYYNVCRYYYETVWGESQGGVALLHNKRELKDYITKHKLRTPTNEEMNRLLGDKKYRVRVNLEPGELEDTTLTAEEEKYLHSPEFGK